MVSLASIAGALRRRLPQSIEIGGCMVELPPRSLLKAYRTHYQRYDRSLADIAALMHQSYPSLTAIDVGANVGDTAALMRTHVKIPVLCVEGDPKVLPILERNLQNLGSGVAVAPHYVGTAGTFVDLDKVHDGGKNSSIAFAVSAEARGTQVVSLNDILRANPAFSESKLLKSDCEGLDFDILRGAESFLKKARPAVFLEYDPSFRPQEPDAGLETIRFLASLDYTTLVYYDNFGCFLTLLDITDWSRIEDLHAYLLSNTQNGRIIHYFDICALHAEDAHVGGKIRQLEIERTRARSR